MKKVRIFIHKKEERAFFEILSQMIERQRMSINPIRLRKDGKNMLELSAS